MLVDESRPPVVRVKMDRLETRNRLDDCMLSELIAAVDRAEATPDARVLVLEAVGDTFCAGLSLGGVQEADWRSRIGAVRTLLRRLSSSPLVTIAVVNGAALGGGVGLAAACDQVIAHPEATFRMTEVLVGLVPATILPVVASRVGEHRAFSLALMAKQVSATEAEGIGLADLLGGERELRGLVVGLRGATNSAVRAMKDYRMKHFPPRFVKEDLVLEVLRERLADTETRGRIDRLHENGLVS